MSTALPLLLEPEQLAAHLNDDNLLIVDLCKRAVYEQAHVPGAIHVDFSVLQKGTQPAPGLLPDTDALSELFSSIGLTPDTQVVAYDDEGGGWAGRFLWMLDVIGHTRYAYLNGGIHAWLDSEQPVATEVTLPHPSHYQVTHLNDTAQADLAYVLAHYQDDDVVIWDARSEEEFAGVRAFAQKGGHIPGARHYEWTQAMDRQRQLRLRDLDTLKQELASRGISADKRIITHCQTHHRSGLTWLIGKILGFDIRAYAGSWSEWGNHPDTPCEKTEY